VTRKPLNNSLLVVLMQGLRRRSAAQQRRFLMMNLADLDPLPLGPGWFDSSWELENGLEVCEAQTPGIEFRAWIESTQREPTFTAVRGAAASGDNLIEFDVADQGVWHLPAERAKPRQQQRDRT
jgi:hypothetical protein